MLAISTETPTITSSFFRTEPIKMLRQAMARVKARMFRKEINVLPRFKWKNSLPAAIRMADCNSPMSTRPRNLPPKSSANDAEE